MCEKGYRKDFGTGNTLASYKIPQDNHGNACSFLQEIIRTEEVKMADRITAASIPESFFSNHFLLFESRSEPDHQKAHFKLMLRSTNWVTDYVSPTFYLPCSKFCAWCRQTDMEFRWKFQQEHNFYVLAKHHKNLDGWTPQSHITFLFQSRNCKTIGKCIWNGKK